MNHETKTEEQVSSPADAFTRLVDEHRGIALKVAGVYCWHPDDRADLVQDILVQTWRAYGSYDPSRTFSTWFYRIALNVAVSSVRVRYRRPDEVAFDGARHDHADEAGDRAEADERVRALYRVIDQLDGLNRALLLLHLDEHSHRDIAEILGITETNVATKLSRLRARLRGELLPTP